MKESQIEKKWPFIIINEYKRVGLTANIPNETNYLLERGLLQIITTQYIKNAFEPIYNKWEKLMLFSIVFHPVQRYNDEEWTSTIEGLELTFH